MQPGQAAQLHSRKQRLPEQTKHAHEECPITTFAIVSVRFKEVTIATYLSQFITAARTRDERKLWALAEALFVRGLGTGPLISFATCNQQLTF